MDELADKLPLWQRLKTVLSGGPQTLAALAERLGSKVDTIDKTARRKSLVFVRLTNHPNGIAPLALVDRRVS